MYRTLSVHHAGPYRYDIVALVLVPCRLLLFAGPNVCLDQLLAVDSDCRLHMCTHATRRLPDCHLVHFVIESGGVERFAEFECPRGVLARRLILQRVRAVAIVLNDLRQIRQCRCSHLARDHVQTCAQVGWATP